MELFYLTSTMKLIQPLMKYHLHFPVYVAALEECQPTKLPPRVTHPAITMRVTSSGKIKRVFINRSRHNEQECEG